MLVDAGRMLQKERRSFSSHMGNRTDIPAFSPPSSSKDGRSEPRGKLIASTDALQEALSQSVTGKLWPSGLLICAAKIYS